jgi:hypothetical protein
MQVEFEYARERWEIAVSGEHGPVSTRCDCANKEVGIRSLNARGLAPVEALRRLLEVCTLYSVIGECAEMVSQQIELLRLLEPGQELLTDWSDHDHAAFANDFCQLPNNRSRRLTLAPKRQRPDGRIDEHLHARRRCFL